MFGELALLLFIFLFLVGIGARQWEMATLGGMGLSVLGVAWLWGRLSLERVSYQRKLSQARLFPGEKTTLSISVTNRKALPLSWLRLEDRLREELAVEGRELEVAAQVRTMALVHETSLSWYERVTWTYEILPTGRGYHKIGPSFITTGDIFGLFPAEKRVEEESYILVFPRVVPLPDLGLVPRRPLGDFRGGPPFYYDTARPAGVRDYQPGDPLKQVDWKATARLGALQVRVLEPSVSMNVALFVNLLTTEEKWGWYIPAHLERCITLAASLAQQLLSEGHQVGLYTNGVSAVNDRPMAVPPARDPRQLITILETLALATPVTRGSIEEVLLKELPHLIAGTLVALITALSSPDTARALEIGEARRAGVVVLWVSDDPPEAETIPESVRLVRLESYLAGMGV
ncbi:MAG: DUF58 domain-containing protein [Chloroflexi bacterium]|nr:DUF58 domain-containing protein [Chloroflexota bacterium]